ncbi:MAG: aspartate/tyrosine/aromatic aminotransferase [Rhodobacteraceae bacterium]|nr:aspartate/tyrosine/aromatic aminotransferase [Paracoccaceae bacterium]
MLESLKPQPPDKIIGLMQLFREDPRTDKIDLGVGVYRNADGLTPIMAAIKDAERQLLREQTTKTYTALAGEPEYRDAMVELVLADAVNRQCVAALHTAGGTGAVRLALELAQSASPGISVWIPTPSWPSHASIAKHLKLSSRTYRYFDHESKLVAFDNMMSDLAQMRKGDAVILHGCCHNPTGADLNAGQWSELSTLLESKEALPIVDFAYQGFGDGLEEDARGVRELAVKFDEVMIAASCSKNFGVYRERTGALLVRTENTRTAGLIQGQLAYLNRQSISFPPDHGARLVTMVLRDAALRSSWLNELNAIRGSLQHLRQSLADELRKLSGSDRFSFIVSHKGMFTLLGATDEQVAAMRRKHGIYLVGGGRINIAGLSERTVPIMAAAMLDVGM